MTVSADFAPAEEAARPDAAGAGKVDVDDVGPDADTGSAQDDLLLERQLCFALSVASRTVVHGYKPVLDPLGITHPQYLVMLALWERSPRTVKDLSATLRHKPATLSPLLKRLEAAGYVTRQRAAGHERSLAVGLTDAGAGLRDQAVAIPAVMGRRLGMDREDLTQLHAMMTRLINAAAHASAVQ